MRTTQRPFQLFDPFSLLFIRPRGCALPPKRSQCTLFHFVFPAVVQRRSDLMLAASLSYIAALHGFHHNLKLLFRSSLDLRSSSHLASWRRPSILTIKRVQF